MDECIFCKIIRGDIPSDTVYEDEHTIAFLDIAPVTKGHTLVVPKKHYPNLYETPDDVLATIIKTTKYLSTKIKKTLSADGINIINNNDPAAGQVVDHIHIHVIPRYKDDGLEHWKSEFTYQDGEKEAIKENISL